MSFPDLNQPATQSALAKLLDVNRSTIHGHHESGVFTKDATLGVWMQEYFKKLQDAAAGRAESTEDGKAIMNRLNLAKAIKTELEIAKDEKTLVLQSDVRDEMESAFLHIKTTLDALPSRVAAALSAQYGHPIDKRLIENECRTALSAIADYTPECEAAD